MRRPIIGRARRKGAFAPLAALLLTVLVGMLAFSIDMGYVVSVRAELQNAADSAALAAAQRLQQPYVQYYANGQTNKQGIYTTVTTDTSASSSPIPTAQAYASNNTAGGVTVTLPASDVSFSYYDGTTYTPASFPTYFPNSVTVTTRRDGTANGSLGLFFAQIFGIATMDVTATATATIYAGDVTSLQSIQGVKAHILPVAVDVNFWKTFATTGVSPDGTTVQGSNGLPQMHVYPNPGNAPGSFGLLDVGLPANNAPAFRSWINGGETPNDISYLVNNNLVPVYPNTPQSWKVGPGMTSTLQDSFQSVMGEPNLLPLFKPVNDGSNGNYQAASGNGQNATYAIVGFIGVTVSQADGRGNNMDISVQPMAMVDPTALIPTPIPASPSQTSSATGTQVTTFVSAKLTQ
jgi:Flp pilus assembly protein TadG